MNVPTPGPAADASFADAPPADRPFLIIETGQPVRNLRRHGRFAHWIRVAAGLPADRALIVNVESGEPLPAPTGATTAALAGVIVTGSSAMVTDRHAWSERTAEWLREALDTRLPLLGICYGHQLLAHALGGEVGYNPSGREMGTVPVRLHPDAAEDILFGPMPAQFPAQTSHLQTVLRPPRESAVLARSDLDACQSFRWRDHAWGVQFHPEFSTGHMRGYVHARRNDLQRDGRCHHRVSREVKPTPQARGLLRRFIRHAHTLRHR